MADDIKREGGWRDTVFPAAMALGLSTSPTNVSGPVGGHTPLKSPNAPTQSQEVQDAEKYAKMRDKQRRRQLKNQQSVRVSAAENLRDMGFRSQPVRLEKALIRCVQELTKTAESMEDAKSDAFKTDSSDQLNLRRTGFQTYSASSGGHRVQLKKEKRKSGETKWVIRIDRKIKGESHILRSAKLICMDLLRELASGDVPKSASVKITAKSTKIAAPVTSTPKTSSTWRTVEPVMLNVEDSPAKDAYVSDEPFVFVGSDGIFYIVRSQKTGKRYAISPNIFQKAFSPLSGGGGGVAGHALPKPVPANFRGLPMHGPIRDRGVARPSGPSGLPRLVPKKGSLLGSVKVTAKSLILTHPQTLWYGTTNNMPRSVRIAAKKTLERLLAKAPQDEARIRQLAAEDPTNNHDWLDRMYLWMTQGMDIQRISNAVHELDRYSRSLKEQNKPINPFGYATLPDLENSLESIKQSGAQPKLRKRDAKYQVVYEGNGMTLYKVENKAASCVLGSDSDWCSSKWDADWYESRQKIGQIYIARFADGRAYMVRVNGNTLVTAYDKRDNNVLGGKDAGLREVLSVLRDKNICSDSGEDEDEGTSKDLVLAEMSVILDRYLGGAYGWSTREEYGWASDYVIYGHFALQTNGATLDGTVEEIVSWARRDWDWDDDDDGSASAIIRKWSRQTDRQNANETIESFWIDGGAFIRVDGIRLDGTEGIAPAYVLSGLTSTVGSRQIIEMLERVTDWSKVPTSPPTPNKWESIYALATTLIDSPDADCEDNEAVVSAIKWASQGVTDEDLARVLVANADSETSLSLEELERALLPEKTSQEGDTVAAKSAGVIAGVIATKASDGDETPSYSESVRPGDHVRVTENVEVDGIQISAGETGEVISVNLSGPSVEIEVMGSKSSRRGVTITLVTVSLPLDLVSLLKTVD